MAAPRKLPDKTTLERLRRQGATYKDIAERYDVTEAAVYLRLKADGLSKDRKVSHKELMPWSIKAEHAHAHVALMLRLLSRRQQGLGNSPVRERMLDKWLGEVEAANVVVCYDPNMGKNPASPTGGWFYMRRTRKDGVSIIRYAAPGKGLPKGYDPSKA